MAIKRLLLIHSIILSTGGIPLIYMGDEIAQLNNYSWKNDPKKQDDSRWTHRQQHDWDATEKRHDINTIQGQMYQGLIDIINIRKNTPALGDGMSTFFSTQNSHVLGYIRSKSVLILANFSEQEQVVKKDILLAYADIGDTVYDLRYKEDMTLGSDIILAPYQFIWIKYN